MLRSLIGDLASDLDARKHEQSHVTNRSCALEFFSCSLILFLHRGTVATRWTTLTHNRQVKPSIFPETRLLTCISTKLTGFFLLCLQDLQSEIEQHQHAFETLQTTGQSVARGADNTDGKVLSRRLEEMNRRWCSLKSKSVEIRCVSQVFTSCPALKFTSLSSSTKDGNFDITAHRARS